MNKFKSLFIVSDDKNDVKEEKRVSKFPSSTTATTTFPSSPSTPFMDSTATVPPIPTMGVPLECAPHMDSVMKLYEDGFASLNRPGIEFFEFFESVMEAGLNDPAAYKLALKFFSKQERTMTKESLIYQSQYYIDELTKVHTANNAKGIQMKANLMADKDAESQKLKGDIKLLQDQMESIKNQLLTKQTQLSQIDVKYQPKIQEFDCKMMANDEAKNRILSTITTVVNGIKTNL